MDKVISHTGKVHYLIQAPCRIIQGNNFCEGVYDVTLCGCGVSFTPTGPYKRYYMRVNAQVDCKTCIKSERRIRCQ